jgi:monoamine oxidase
MPLDPDPSRRAGPLPTARPAERPTEGGPVTPPSARVAIVGGGLAGLVAAMLLQQQGVDDVVLFEARGTLGGRILSVGADGVLVDGASPLREGFDLGPTWFWPALQPQLDRLVDDLGLQRFEQFDRGDLLVERSAREGVLRIGGHAASPPAVRLSGGIGALVAAIHRRLDPRRIFTAQAVHRLRCAGAHVALDIEHASGGRSTWRAGHVLLALPPRLAERRIAFDPPLPPGLAGPWRATATWMAPHAKYLAVYDAPFWRAQGLSGAVRSALGPMTEIHDASLPGGPAALFGFLGVPARVRLDRDGPTLRAHCRMQLARLFGSRAGAPLADALKDWAADPLTATEDDREAGGPHAEAPPAAADSGPWRGE